MKLLLISFLLIMAPTNYVLFNFTEDANLSNWRIEDDGVMGGLSQGFFELNEQGHGVFYGNVRLENNGGFSSVRYNFDAVNVAEYSKVCIRLKGDGKKYQFRIQDKNDTYYSYIFPFETSGDWETIEIKLSDMYPSFRGRKLDLPNFSETQITEVRFLIGNKKKESFQLLIDRIELK